MWFATAALAKLSQAADKQTRTQTESDTLQTHCVIIRVAYSLQRRKPILCSEKTPTHVFRYISVENAYICTKFLGNVYQETSNPKIENNILFATSDVMLTSYFHICKLCVLPLKTDIR